MTLTALDMMKGWVEDLTFKNRTLEEENKSLKLKISELTEELEMERRSNGNNGVNVEGQVEEVNRSSGHRMQKANDVQSESDLNNGQQNPRETISSSSDGDDNDSDGEFNQPRIPIETSPSMDDNYEIDIKEEDVGYEQSKFESNGNNSIRDPILLDPSSDIPVKHEVDRSIQRMFCSPDQVSNSEHSPEDIDDLSQSSSSIMTENVLGQELVISQPQVSSHKSSGKKVPCLTTRTAEKIHTCETCSAYFDTEFKLMYHNKTHTGDKTVLKTLRTRVNCPVCQKSVPRSVLSEHMRSHTGEKPSAKRCLTVKEVNPRGGEPSRKQRKVETEPEVCNDEKMSEVGDGIDQPCEVETNPLKIKKILGLILSNLGKHDLLNARMVSHAWNDEGLKVLRKSKFTQLLESWQIKKYLLFNSPTPPRPFIVPFHLRIIDLESSGPSSLKALTSDVDSLCKVFGPECISTLTLTADDEDYTGENAKEMTEFLTLISSGLKTLDLTSLRFKINFRKIQSQIITFPILRKLICNTLHCAYGRRGPGPSYISIIENSPNLEHLTLTHPCDLDSWPLNFNQLKYLSLNEMIRPQILDKILDTCGRPVLRELSLRHTMLWTGDEIIVVYNILNAVSSTLKSLRISGCFFDLRGKRFPKLPHLEHLGLEFTIGVGYQFWVNLKDINLSEETFPSLKSLEIPVGFISKPSHVQSQEDDGFRIELPKLMKLILRVSDTLNSDHEYLKRAFEHLQKISPTSSKLSLVNVGRKRNDCVEYLLDFILKLIWSKNIQEIEMIGFSPEVLNLPLEFIPRDVSEKYDGILEEELKNELKNSMRRTRKEFGETVVTPDSIILIRKNQSDCLNDKI